MKKKSMFDKKSLIAFLIAFHHSHERVPTRKDLNKYPDMPSYSTYRKFFGSYRNAIKEAGLKKGKIMKKIISLLIAIVLSGNIVYAGIGVDLFYKGKLDSNSFFLGMNQSARGLRFSADKDKILFIYSEIEMDRGYSFYVPGIDKNILRMGFKVDAENIIINFFIQSTRLVNLPYKLKKPPLLSYIQIDIPLFYYKAKE